jgi:single-strand selective monofunctional uracil DNA glycosylase
VTVAAELGRVSRSLSAALSGVQPAAPVTHVLDPTVYARRSHEAFLQAAERPIEALLLGMNPGPWGMAQTGVPFGEVQHVRSFLGIDEPVEQPEGAHPKRPISGFDCPRSEVSGRRLWGWVSDRFGTAGAFFERFFVWNWCPLVFLEASGRNRTPDKLDAEARAVIEPACDEAVRRVVAALEPSMVIGVGAFARARASKALSGLDLPVHQILHPSPASPAANRGWAPQIERQLDAIGVDLPADDQAAISARED